MIEENIPTTIIRINIKKLANEKSVGSLGGVNKNIPKKKNKKSMVVAQAIKTSIRHFNFDEDNF